MIHTITLNPSIDYFLRLPALNPGGLHRCGDARLTAGGKGINVALVLREMGLAATAHGFAAGPTGEMLAGLLRETGLPVRLTQVQEGMTRINVKILAQEETELNGAGPCVTAEEFSALADGVLEGLAAGDGVVLSGSACPGADPEQCAALLKKAQEKGAFTVVDVSGEALRVLARTRPFLVKPNDAELAALYGVDPAEREALVDAARRLQAEGVRNVLVSRGAAGAFLLGEDGAVCERPALCGTACGTVGAGDSMVAGFLAGWLRTGDAAAALEGGIAAGCATAFAGRLCRRAELCRLCPQLWG